MMMIFFWTACQPALFWKPSRTLHITSSALSGSSVLCWCPAVCRNAVKVPTWMLLLGKICGKCPLGCPLCSNAPLHYEHVTNFSVSPHLHVVPFFFVAPAPETSWPHLYILLFIANVTTKPFTCKTDARGKTGALCGSSQHNATASGTFGLKDSKLSKKRRALEHTVYSQKGRWSSIVVVQQYIFFLFGVYVTWHSHWPLVKVLYVLNTMQNV